MRTALKQVLLRSATGLDLNFAGGVFSLNNTRTDSPANIPGWSFSRTDTNGTATALDLAGNVIQFATGVPRITNRGILVEEARTNVLLRSNEFDNASWTLTNTTISANAATAPDGTTTADKIVATAANAQHRADQTAVNSAGTACFSVFLKAAEYGFATIRIGAFGGIVDLSSGSVSGVSVGYTMTATALANGWYRCVLIGAAALNDTVRINAQNATGFALSFAGDGTSGILAWGAQLELGAFATSPIITTGAAGTRGADSATLGSFVLPAAYTWVPEGYAPPIQTGLFPAMMGSTGSNTGLLLTGSTNTPGANMGNGTFNGGYGSAVAAGAMIKQGFRAETNNAMGASNGTLGTVDTSFTPVVGSQTLNIGANNVGTNFWNSYIQRIRVLPYAATDAQLQALTT